VKEGGEMPLEYFLRIMRDPLIDNDRRDWAADKAGPYCHAKLASQELTGKGGGPIVVEIVRFSDTASGE
jgi:hypothetical protein